MSKPTRLVREGGCISGSIRPSFRCPFARDGEPATRNMGEMIDAVLRNVLGRRRGRIHRPKRSQQGLFHFRLAGKRTGPLAKL